MIQRNPHLKNDEFSAEVILTSPRGGNQLTRVFNQDGIYEVSFLSKAEKALEFHRWVRKLLKALRKGDMQLTMNNVAFVSELFEAILAKYLGNLNDRASVLENKTFG